MQMPSGSERALAALLRINGVFTALAVVAVFMPMAGMQWLHARLNVGPAPATPVFEYMARTVSALYVIHGGLCFVLASDVRRFGPVITYTASAQLVFAAVVLWVDYKVGLPRLWVAVEAPAILLMGGLTLYLRGRSREE
jgi:hypothetical protein